MDKRILVLALVVFIVLFTACGESPAKVVKSLYGDSKIVVPGGWSEMDDLHDDADIKLGNIFSEQYLIVLSEAKMDFDDDLTFHEHADLTLGFLFEGLKNGKILSGPTDITVMGRDAVQYELTGSVDGIKIYYFHTTVDGNEGYHQIMAWTLPSKVKKVKEEMLKVINSFEEIAQDY